MVAVVRLAAVAAELLAEVPLLALYWPYVEAAVGVVVMAIAPDQLLPVVGRERKSTGPDVGYHEMTLAIFVSRWLRDLLEEATRSFAVALFVKVAAIPVV